MSFSYLPALLRSTFLDLAHWLHKRSAARLPWLLTGILFAKGRRTVTSWFRAAGIRDDHRQGYVTVCAAGRAANSMALTVQAAVRPLLDRRRLLLGIDDTLTPRYGPHVKGCGIHHNHSPGPAGEPYVYGHVWVVLAALARHPNGTRSPCSCRPNSTSAPRMSLSYPPSGHVPSAPSWSWPPSNSAGCCPGWRTPSSSAG